MIVSGKVHEIVFIIQKLNLVEKKIQELKKIEFSAHQHYFFKELSDLLRRGVIHRVVMWQSNTAEMVF